MLREIKPLKRAKLKVLLKPLYFRFNEVSCKSESDQEFCFHEDDLESSEEEGKLRLKTEILVEDVFNDLAFCQINGYPYNFIIALQDLEMISDKQ
jgi:hypothetical protein